MFGVMEVTVTYTDSSNKGRQANNRICKENRGDVMVWKFLLTFICQLVVSTPLIKHRPLNSDMMSQCTVVNVWDAVPVCSWFYVQHSLWIKETNFSQSSSLNSSCDYSTLLILQIIENRLLAYMLEVGSKFPRMFTSIYVITYGENQIAVAKIKPANQNLKSNTRKTEKCETCYLLLLHAFI